MSDEKDRISTLAEVDKTLLLKAGWKSKTVSTLLNFTKIQLVSMIRTLEHNYSVALERCENQYNLLTKPKEDNEALVWHDLRVNPKDLPEKFIDVLVCVIDAFGDKSYTISRYGVYSVFSNRVCELWSGFDNVVAWCEIPKFKGSRLEREGEH